MTENVKTPKVLDSFALLAFLNKEAGFEQVRTLLYTAEAAGEPLLMNEINVGEVFYIIAKARSLEKAEDFLHRLATLPIKPVSNTFPDVLEAARVKAQFPLSYADAFAVSTALRAQAIVITGDPEFHTVAHLVEILWL
jgi:predicted nucleic acid-binding protein